ncbi:septal ring factor EnvC (AmiA/AmiB activator) [Spinactinospora alkalitolerans]|uniref:Septal ring factor EnvC (AmiA/AmiB activator) n=1 Tax=Spinactinospora alkalitolerans TaxID=687207 RepID=A0A852U0M1_9ACTN|nr:M15 family metallopeptidase [Spinactinospora alkalitolerans]NYE48882.1 septal ring factor EnvC (AmiA/AmiB activator) [Spinactinospora alkalitolerans]
MRHSDCASLRPAQGPDRGRGRPEQWSPPRRRRGRHRRRRGRGGARTATALVLGTWLALSITASAGADPTPGTDEIERSRRAEAGHEESIAVLKGRLAEVRARLADLQADADAAILDYREEADRLEKAEQAYEAADRKAGRAAERHEESRRNAAGYAVSAYKGADLSMLSAWVEPGGPQEIMDRSGYVRLLAGHRKDVLDRTDASDIAAETLRDHAESAEEEQQEATGDAAEARERALAAVHEQEEAMESILAEQSEVEAELLAAQDNTAELEREREEALEQAEQAEQAAEGGGSALGRQNDGGGSSGGDGSTRQGSATGGCTGRSTGGFANGQIPWSALCPLPQAGEMLRADAAADFIRLDGAFRERFGRPMCVTDSYRPLSEQVRLFHQMQAGMAARPGTSMHGLGIAVDLCGGVNVHGSTEYRWMMANAPGHGWHNPGWAQNGFEPWHWEYTG